MQNPVLIGYGGLALAALTSSFTPILVRLCEAGPIATGFWRLGFAALLLAAFYRARGVPLASPVPLLSRDYRLLVLGGVLLGVSLSAWQFSIVATSIANASVLGTVHPFVTAAGGWLLLRERVGLRYVAGALIAFTGIVWLVRESAGAMTTVTLGDLMAIASSFTFAGWILTLRGLRRTFALPQATVLPLAYASATMLFIALVTDDRLWPASPTGWFVLAGFALWSNVIGQTGFVAASAHVKAAVISLAMLVVPALATTMGWMLFGEAVALAQALAAATVLAGVALAQWPRAASRAAPIS